MTDISQYEDHRQGMAGRMQSPVFTADMKLRVSVKQYGCKEYTPLISGQTL